MFLTFELWFKGNKVPVALKAVSEDSCFVCLTFLLPTCEGHFAMSTSFFILSPWDMTETAPVPI